jgi:hypothetical protein
MIGLCIHKQISWLTARGFVLCRGFATRATGKTGGMEVRLNMEGEQDYTASPSPFQHVA